MASTRLPRHAAGLFLGIASLGALYACGSSANEGTDGPNVIGDGGGTLIPDPTADLDAGDDVITSLGPSVITVGGTFACAVANDTSVWCWGKNDSGQLGRDPATTPACGGSRCGAPAKVAGITGVTQLAAGDDFACALASTGSVSCWGSNLQGQLAASGLSASFTPRSILARATAVSAAGSHACALTTDGFAYCWGENNCELFQTKDATQPVAKQVPNLPKMTQISVGTDAICVTLEDQTALCWGADHKGSLGHDGVSAGSCNSVPYDPIPKHVASMNAGLPIDKVSDIHTGTGFACLRQISGQVMCWGDNQRGGVGQGFPDTNPHARAVEVPALVVKKLAVQGGTACALSSDKLLCWGDGQFGQLDTSVPVTECGNQVCRALPYVMPGVTSVRELAVGPATTSVITADHSLLVWGRNTSAELGIAPTDGRNKTCPGGVCILAPTPLPGGPTIL